MEKAAEVLWVREAKEPEESEARLLYVAMTRATDRLIMTSSKESKFSQRVVAAVDAA